MPILVLGVRYFTAEALAAARRLPSTWTASLGGLGGRGLTSAVLLVIPLGIIPGAVHLFLPGVILVFGTEIAMTIWLASLGRRVPTSGPQPGVELYAPVAAQLPLLEQLAQEDTGRWVPSLVSTPTANPPHAEPPSPPS